MTLLAERLKNLRLQKNAKQVDIAEYIGVLPRTIRFYESGEREPSLDVLIKLADYFGVTADYLLGRSDD